MKTNIDWNELGIGELEDPRDTKVRLDAIHRAILQEKNIATKPDKNSPGFQPSLQQAREVAVMTALGLEPKDIALVLNVEVPLLKLYYAKELKVSHNLANAMVARQALAMALSGRFPDMTKFWLKSQAGWTEKAPDAPNDPRQGGDMGSAKERLKRAVNSSLPKPSNS